MTTTDHSILIGTIKTDQGRAEVRYEHDPVTSVKTLRGHLPDGTIEQIVEGAAITTLTKAIAEAEALYRVEPWDWQPNPELA